MLRITAGKGFQMTFDNGWTVSVQFGRGNYCENRYSEEEARYSKGDAYHHDAKCVNAEVMRWHGPRNNGNEPIGWQTPDQVAKFIADTANMEAK